MDGRVGVLYQQLTGPGGARRWGFRVQFTRNGIDWHDVLLANTATTWTGDYTGMLAHGRHSYGTFATDNTPNPANFPFGVRYQRNANFATQQLLDLTNTIVISPSIDPFFFEITFEEEEEEEEEKEEHGFEFEKLEIEGLRFERGGEDDEEDENHDRRESRRLSRLLSCIIHHIEREEDDDE